MNSQKTIATVGMFDGVHRGHRDLLRRLSEEGAVRGLAPAVITFDAHPLALIAPEKAPLSLMTVDDKVAAIRAEGVDRVDVLKFDNALRALTAEQFMERLRDHYDVEALLLGFNHRFGSDRIDDIAHYQAIGRKLGMEVIRADELNDPSSPGLCSSSIRQALVEGDIATANAMLGRPYRLVGRVVSGHRLGRTIGFPTANIVAVDSRQLIPANGVYAADVILTSGERVRAMVNIGVRPTVDTSANPVVSIEVHLIDWSGDLYGATLAVDFLARLRSEMRFPSLAALRTQLIADRLSAKSW